MVKLKIALLIIAVLVSGVSVAAVMKNRGFGVNKAVISTSDKDFPTSENVTVPESEESLGQGNQPKVEEIQKDTSEEEESDQADEEPDTDDETRETVTPTYPLKDEDQYPIIDEIKNHEIASLLKEGDGGDKEDSWYQNISENQENHLIGQAYEQLEDTKDVLYMDYDKQGGLFKDYLEKLYADYVESEF